MRNLKVERLPAQHPWRRERTVTQTSAFEVCGSYREKPANLRSGVRFVVMACEEPRTSKAEVRATALLFAGFIIFLTL